MDPSPRGSSETQNVEHQSSSFLEILYYYISHERGQPVFAGSVGFGVEVCLGFFYYCVCFVLLVFLIVALRKSIIAMRVQQNKQAK